LGQKRRKNSSLNGENDEGIEGLKKERDERIVGVKCEENRRA
jgi:hypothetical protein